MKSAIARAISASLLAAVSLVFAGPVAADSFPTKPITFVVPWPAGGATDVVARAMAEAAGKHIGQPIVVENKAGASGTLGPATVAGNAKPDGYTIVQMPITVYRFPVMKGKNVSWDPFKDFSYIIHLTGYTFAIGTKADSKFKTWKDVVDYAKANPGKLTYGTPGAGTSLHIGMELISGHDKFTATHVPFKGGAETTAALAGGHVDISVEGTTMMPLVEAGQLRLLMVWTEKRIPAFPDIPSLRDLNYPWTFDSPWGIAGPKGMDPAVVRKIHDAFKASLDDTRVKAAMAKHLMPPRYADPKGYLEIVKQITAFEAEGVKRIGLGKD
ncbi:MAG: tripartite tricarboxylate transporter substrate binding protein [Hyphomicrobiaceae bacterium]|nr:tripartite tricarboxylate transporter substrate binding protein [Hyphomicrobiaceae bacterium]